MQDKSPKPQQTPEARQLKPQPLKLQPPLDSQQSPTPQPIQQSLKPKQLPTIQQSPTPQNQLTRNPASTEGKSIQTQITSQNPPKNPSKNPSKNATQNTIKSPTKSTQIIASATELAIGLLKKALNARISITGQEDIDKERSILFVANHFTRFETFLLPYLLKNICNKYCKSLADHALFDTYLGKYLDQLYSVSTNDPERNQKIVNDLVGNEFNWLIYPEGNMLKKKSIYARRGFRGTEISARTGSAVFALQAEMSRIFKIKSKQQFTEGSDHLHEKFKSIQVCPVSISYSNIYPTRNILYKTAKLIAGNISDRFKEELMIESNILLNSEIVIHFSKPIDISSYIKNKYYLYNHQKVLSKPTLDKETNKVTKSKRHKLSYDFIRNIYDNISLGFNHFVAILICKIVQNKQFKTIEQANSLNPTEKQITNCSEGSACIEAAYFAEMLFCIIAEIKEHHKEIKISPLLKFYTLLELLKKDLSKFSLFEELLTGVKSQDCIQIQGEYLIFNITGIFSPYSLHNIRISSTLQVLYNESQYFTNLIKVSGKISKLSKKNLERACCKRLIELDYAQFVQDYYKSHCDEDSMTFKYGGPKLYKTQSLRKKAKFGVVISHGWCSCPKQTRILCEALQKNGIESYNIRLKGHGTNSSELSQINYQEWLNSYQVGIEIIKRSCDKVFLSGFSMGGIISLLKSIDSAEEGYSSNVAGIISISPSIKAESFAFKFSKVAYLFSEIAEKFSENAKGYVTPASEFTEISYTRKYFASLVALSDLMQECNKKLPEITKPLLLISNPLDPIVDPIGFQTLKDKIKSKHKVYHELKFIYHNIFKSTDFPEIVPVIKKFILDTVKNSQKSPQ